LTSGKISPERIARKVILRLEELADPVKAEGAQRYFKEAFKCYGLTSAQVRDLAKEISIAVAPIWSVEDAVALCDILLPNPFHEAKAVSILVLERYREDFPPSVFLKIKSWLASDYLNSWAGVDVLCPNCVGSLLEKYPKLVGKIEGWAGSPNRWVKRASLVSFIKLARKAEFLGPVYRMSAAHFPDNDDLIQKANGWLLREAGKADAARLEKFLLKHGPAIPRTTLRYAIERFDDKKRRAVLAATRKN
jgi:3-methyladenine DNA glycosylase AlkD